MTAALLAAFVLGGALVPPVQAQQEASYGQSLIEAEPSRQAVAERQEQQRERLLNRLTEAASNDAQKRKVAFLERLFELRDQHPDDPRLEAVLKKRLRVVYRTILESGETGFDGGAKTFRSIGASETVYRPDPPNPELNFDYTGRPAFAGDINGDGNNDYVYFTTSTGPGDPPDVPDERGAEQGDRTPKTAVYFGRPGGPREEPDQLFYARVRPVGDVNGDGYDDAIAFEAEDGTFDSGYRIFTGSPSGYQKGDLIGGQVDDGSDLTVRGFSDLDGDGYDDILLYFAGEFFQGFSVIYGGPDLNLDANFATYSIGGSFAGGEVAKVADLDGDGKGTIVTAGVDLSGVFSGKFQSQVRVFDVNEDREATQRQTLSFPEGYGAFAPSPVDVTGNDTLNVLTRSAGFAGDRILSFTEENPDSLGVENVTLSGVPIPAGDLNGDGRHDFLRLDTERDRWYVSYTPENLAQGLSYDQRIPQSSGEEIDVPALLPDEGLGDINGDGVDDAIVDYTKFSPGADGAILVGQRFVFGGEGGTLDFTTTSIPIEETADQVVATTNVGDVNGDGVPDFAVNRATARQIEIYFGRPSLRSSPDLTIDAPSLSPDEPSGQRGVEAGDFNGDGYSDIAIASLRQRRIDIYAGGPDMDASADVTLNAFQLGFGSEPRIANPRNIGDVNNDGADDLMVLGSPSPRSGEPLFDLGLLFFGGDTLPTSPDAVVEAPLRRGEFRQPISGTAKIGDMDGDGIDDFALGTPVSDKVYVFTGGEEPSFSFDTAAFVLETPRTAFQNVAADFGDPVFGGFGRLAGGDFNGDGAADIAVATVPTNGEPGARIPIFFGGGNADEKVDRVLDVPADPLGLPTGGGFGPGPTNTIANEGIQNLTPTPDADQDGADEMLLGTSGTGAYLYTSAEDTETPVVLRAPNPDGGGLGQVTLPGFGRSTEGDAVGDFNADGTMDFVLTQVFDNQDFNISSRVHRFEASGLEETGTLLEPSAATAASPGEQVAVDVRIGSDDAPVQDLFSVSFQLEYDADHLSVAGGSAGSFVGDDVVFATDGSESGVVEVGVSRKDESGTVDGAGVVGTLQFAVADDAPEGSSLPFRLTAVEAKDAEGNPIDLKTGTDRSVVYPSSVSAAATQSTDGSYRLVALPGNPDGLSVADGFSGSAGADWQAYWDTGARKDPYVTFDGSDTFNFRPGRGFWITGAQDFTVEESLPSVSLNDRNEAVVDVHGGWNIISNPLGRPVTWTAVEEANEEALQPLWSYEGGSYARADTFQSARGGQAYYFLNNRGLDSLRIPYPMGVQQAKSASPPVATGRSVRLVALSGGDVVSAATVGSREEAEDGRGPYDFVAPPTRFQEASLRIQPPGESSPDGRRTYLATEYRPPSADGHRFDLVLSATPGEPVVVRAEELRGIGDRRVALIDGSGEQHDLRSGAARIVPEQKQTSLKLVVGTASLVEETAGEVLPDRLRLRGNYPNPFNEQTTITYDLPETKTVEVAVYDMLGRRVKTLVDQKQEPGTHRVRWQAQSDDARAVSSGVYFVRLETGSTQLVEKLVVVR